MHRETSSKAASHNTGIQQKHNNDDSVRLSIHYYLTVWGGILAPGGSSVHCHPLSSKTVELPFTSLFASVLLQSRVLNPLTPTVAI